VSERAQDWIDQAEWNLKHAENDVRGEYYEWACFSAQQTAEKALKALYQSQNQVAWAALSNIGIPVDVLPVTESELQDRADEPFWREVLAERERLA